MQAKYIVFTVELLPSIKTGHYSLILKGRAKWPKARHITYNYLIYIRICQTNNYVK